jgi:hypothetical protein
MITSRSLSGEPHRPRVRRVPDGYISISALASTVPMSKGAIYLAIKKRQLSACQWRGKLVVSEAAANDFFAVKPLDPGASNGSVGVVKSGVTDYD